MCVCVWCVTEFKIACMNMDYFPVDTPLKKMTPLSKQPLAATNPWTFIYLTMRKYSPLTEKPVCCPSEISVSVKDRLQVWLSLVFCLFSASGLNIINALPLYLRHWCSQNPILCTLQFFSQWSFSQQWFQLLLLYLHYPLKPHVGRYQQTLQISRNATP